eukprot:COSAG05_NODE_3157_length_2280_cov_1.279688_1_plen_245_part_00
MTSLKWKWGGGAVLPFCGLARLTSVGKCSDRDPPIGGMSTRGNVWCGNATSQTQADWHGYCAAETIHNQWKAFGFNGLDLLMSAMSTTVSLSTLLFIASSKQAAHQGRPARLVLPMYEKFLLVYVLVTAFASAVALVQSPNRDGGPVNEWLCDNLSPGIIAAAVGLDWGLYHWTLEGLAFFLMQKGAGARALRRALRRSTVIGAAFFVLAASSVYQLHKIIVETAFLWHLELTVIYHKYVLQLF